MRRAYTGHENRLVAHLADTEELGALVSLHSGQHDDEPVEWSHERGDLGETTARASR